MKQIKKLVNTPDACDQVLYLYPGLKETDEKLCSKNVKNEDVISKIFNLNKPPSKFGL